MSFNVEEKTPLLSDSTSTQLRSESQIQPQMANQQRALGRWAKRNWILVMFSAIGLCILWGPLVSSVVFPKRWIDSSDVSLESKELPSQPLSSGKVQLEAHIMSKCPDAQACLRQLVVPTMEQVSDKVDFRLSYIGKIDTHSDAVYCMHGPGECLGNIIQLCAQEVYPDPKVFLGFANCMISDYSKIPERSMVEACAMEHSVNITKLNDCIGEGHGQDLLRQSMERSMIEHVTKSCTVRLQGEIRCVRDGGRWYDCPGGSKVSDLVDDIKELYQKQNPEQELF